MRYDSRTVFIFCARRESFSKVRDLSLSQRVEFALHIPHAAHEACHSCFQVNRASVKDFRELVDDQMFPRQVAEGIESDKPLYSPYARTDRFFCR